MRTRRSRRREFWHRWLGRWMTLWRSIEGKQIRRRGKGLMRKPARRWKGRGLSKRIRRRRWQMSQGIQKCCWERSQRKTRVGSFRGKRRMGKRKGIGKGRKMGIRKGERVGKRKGGGAVGGGEEGRRMGEVVPVLSPSIVQGRGLVPEALFLGGPREKGKDRGGECLEVCWCRQPAVPFLQTRGEWERG